jgi:hypothetical protein
MSTARRNIMYVSRVIVAGIMLLSFIYSGTDSPSIPPTEFFFDPQTGDPHVMIVVGEKAASLDIISAVMIAAKLFAVSMTAQMEEYDARKAQQITYTSTHEAIPLCDIQDGLTESWNLGVCTIDVPDNTAYRQVGDISRIYTLKSLWYFDDPHGFWGNNNGRFDPWETHEEIQVRFDAVRTDHSECDFGLYGGRVNLKAPEPFPSWYRVPSIIYRIDNIFVPPSLMLDAPCCYPGPNALYLCDCLSFRRFSLPEPWMVVHHMLPQFKMFNAIYTVVDAGAVGDVTDEYERGPLGETPYLVTGCPHLELKVPLCENELATFGAHTVLLKDWGSGKAHLEISEDGELQEDFWMAMDERTGFPRNLEEEEFPFNAYKACHDVNGNKMLDPGETINILYSTEYIEGQKWVVSFRGGDIWVSFHEERYEDNQGETRWICRLLDFVIDGVEFFIEGDEIAGILVNIYWLENQKAWRSKLCADPWSDSPGEYQLLLDAYQCGWGMPQDHQYQPPGTGLWPGVEVNGSRIDYSTAGVGRLDSNDGYLDCVSAEVGPVNCEESSCIEDPLVWHCPGLIMVEINVCLQKEEELPPVGGLAISGPGTKDNPYFALEVSDASFCDGDGIDYTISMDEPWLKSLVIGQVDEMGIIMTDSEFDFEEWKSACDCNVILIGGPVANTIVERLVNQNISLVDWYASYGGWEYIPALFGGCDILIVAGKSRQWTRKAAQDIIDQL